MLLYIDPGTGSMIFSIAVSIAGLLLFFARTFWIKLKFVLSRGKTKAIDKNTIPICIFSEGKRYWSVFQPICDEFEKRGKEIWYKTASQDDPALSMNYKHVHTEFIGEGNKAISHMNLCNATIVLSTTPGLNVYQWKRSKSAKYYIHLPHMPGDVTRYRMFGLVYYDEILLSGDYQIEQIRTLEKLRHEPVKELTLVGIPYMDVMKARLNKLPQRKTGSEETPVILLAPSWGKSGILTVYGAVFIDKLIKTGYKVIIRPHPQSFFSEKKLMDDLMAKYPNSEKLTWNRDPDNFDVLNEADILISDFSGVLFDFSLVFNKPVIYTDPHYDKSPYDCAWVEKELWTFTTLEKIGKKLTNDNFDNIASIVDECLHGTQAEELARMRDVARQETWCNIGHSTEITVDHLLAKYEELSSKK